MNTFLHLPRIVLSTVMAMSLWAFTPSVLSAASGSPPANAEVPQQASPDEIDDVGLQSIDPARLLDTRGGATVDGNHSGGGSFAHQETRMIQIAGRGGIPQSATLAFLNVTAVGATQEGFLTVWPCESVTGSRPDTSVLNFREGWIRANGVTTALGAGGAVCVYAFGATDVLIDAQAYSSSDAFTAVNPKRVVDTRPNDERFAAGETRMYDLSSQVGDATAVFLNVTAVGNAEGGFLTTWPCADTSTRRPDSSTLNFVPGAAVANNVFAAVNSGRICVYSYAATHVIVDLMGYMDADTPPVAAISPYRVVDTRRGTFAAVSSERSIALRYRDGIVGWDFEPQGAGLAAGRLSESVGPAPWGGWWTKPETRMFQIAGVGPIPLNADSVIANITTADSRHGTGGFLTVWPCLDPTDTVPNASALNYRSGWDVANTGVFALSEFGTLCVHAYEDAHVIIDVTGYTTSGVAPTGDIIAALSSPEGGRSLIRVDVEPAGAAYDVTFHGDQTFTETFTTPYAVTETDLPADNYWMTITASEGSHITSFDFNPLPDDCSTDWWGNSDCYVSFKGGEGIAGTAGICNQIDTIFSDRTQHSNYDDMSGMVFECDIPQGSDAAITVNQQPTVENGELYERLKMLFPAVSVTNEITVTVDGDAGSYSTQVSQPLHPRVEGNSQDYEFHIMDLPEGKNTIRVEVDCDRSGACAYWKNPLSGAFSEHLFTAEETHCTREWCDTAGRIAGDVHSVMAWPDTLTSLKDSLSGLPKLHWVPQHLPSSVTDLSHALSGSPRSSGNVALWDVSNVTNLDGFTGYSQILTDLSGWDVSNVTSMAGLSLGVFAADSVKNWNVSNVTDMRGMHLHVRSGSKCPNIEFARWGRVALRGHERHSPADFSNWDVSNVTDMRGLFERNCGAPPGIEHWDTSSVVNMSGMFADVISVETLNLNNWDTSSVTHMHEMFHDADNGDGTDAPDTTQPTRIEFSEWDTSSVVDMQGMFSHANVTSSGLANWDVSNVENMGFTFAKSTFTGDISKWDVSNVVVADGMFSDSRFNGNITGWQLPKLRSARGMFASTNAFNHDLSAWRTPQLVLFEGLFGRFCDHTCREPAAHPQSVASWGIHQSDGLANIFCDLSVAYFCDEKYLNGRSPTQRSVEWGVISDDVTNVGVIKALDFSSS